MRRVASVVMCCLMTAGPIFALPRSIELRTEEPSSPTQDDPLQPASEVEEFRSQMLAFLADVNDSLTRLAQYPALAAKLADYRERTGIQIPFTDSVYDAIRSASAPELDRLRESLANAPGVFASPDVLRQALAELPPPALGGSGGVTASFAISSCSDNYTEHQKILTKKSVVFALKVTAGSIAFAQIAIDAAAEIAGAITEDVPYVGKNPTIPLMIVAGVLDTVVVGLNFAADELSSDITESELCLASCLTDINPHFAGRGCDNRDNNCAGGIDELGEDQFAPDLAIDASPLSGCFSDEDVAKAAFKLAVTAGDDCQDVTPDITFQSNMGLCTLEGSASVSDGRNTTGPLRMTMKVDPNAPLIILPTLQACYPTLGAARAAVGSAGVFDCPNSSVATKVTAVDKECVADLTLEAVDDCGNRSIAQSTLRVDGTPPHVDIDELLVAPPGKLACFLTEAEAIRTVREATRFDDNCTVADDLLLDMSTAGNACNLLVTSTVTSQDACGGVGSDAYLTRVDSEAPVVSCSLATSLLWPPDLRMVDVGLTIVALDNCDGSSPMIDLEVTSDEATALAYATMGVNDPYPDAVIDRDASGNFQRLWLRAQRSTMDQVDGRVYRIRVTATDSCGFKTSTDCWATVPHTNPDPSTALNSGQNFDATKVN